MAIPTFTNSGVKATTEAKLEDTVFAVNIKNHELLKQAYDTYLANGRDNLAVVKTRGLVRGGGKKPWKQKGTGRARFGSSRNPIWRGGGIVFGPTGLENYSKQMNVKAKQLAARQALTLAAQSDKIIVIEDLAIQAKTAVLAATFTKIGAAGRVLVVLADRSAELDLASANLRNVKLIQPAFVNVYDVLNADKIVITSAALETLTSRLGGTK